MFSFSYLQNFFPLVAVRVTDREEILLVVYGRISPLITLECKEARIEKNAVRCG